MGNNDKSDKKSGTAYENIIAEGCYHGLIEWKEDDKPNKEPKNSLKGRLESEEGSEELGFFD